MSDGLIVFDNVVMSNFLLVGAEGLLADLLSGRMWVTPEVLAENAAGRVAGHVCLARIDWLMSEGYLVEVAMTADERPTFVELLGRLGRGEASCIAVAQQRGVVFASDDRVARACAESRRVTLTGTIGLLVAAVRSIELSVSEADQLLRQMIDGGFFAPVRSIRGLV